MRILYAIPASKGGFSLVELLMVLLLIAFVTAVAIPALGRCHESAGFARDMENARSIASIAQGAEAAGAAVIDSNGSVVQTIRTLSSGVTVMRGAFQGQVYRVSIGEAEIPGAARFLRMENGMLVYSGQ
jgi:prepilin-type N-terminal cleavage/methylation domain-containing protein